MRLLALFAVFLAAPLFAQGNVRVDTEIDGAISRKILPVAIVSDDPVLGGLVQFALSTHGAIEISQVDWDLVTDQVGGLTVAGYYYASDVQPGHLTASAPTTAGHYATQIGVALSATKLQLQIAPPTVIP